MKPAPGERGREAGRRLPHAALAVGAGDDAGDRTAGGEVGEAVLAERVGHAQAREVGRGVDRIVVADRGAQAVDAGFGGRDCGTRVRGPCGWRIDDQHRAPFLTIGRGSRPGRGHQVGVERGRRNAQQVEEVRRLERVQPGARVAVTGDLGVVDRAAVGSGGGGVRRAIDRALVGRGGRPLP